MHQINKFIIAPPFKFKGLNNLAHLLPPRDWSTTINFKDSFFHMEVKRSHQHYLSFTWRNQTYIYQAIPFSMNTSPWAFTCFVKVAICHLCKQGIQCLTYMDNIIILGATKAEAATNTNITTCFLSELGWNINAEKSSLLLTQQLEFLGFIVNTHREPTFLVPQQKIHDTHHNINQLLHLHQS